MSIRQILSLVFVPTSDVITDLEDLIESIFFTNNEDIIRHFINYFEDKWIGRLTRTDGQNCSLMHNGAVLMLLYTIYQEPTILLKDGVEDSAN